MRFGMLVFMTPGLLILFIGEIGGKGGIGVGST